MITELLSALAIGLLGAGHCLGMCGGLIGAMTFALPKGQAKWPYLLGYNLGRILSYTLAGIAAGTLATVVPHLFPQWGATALRLLSGIMLILLALYLAKWNSWLSQLEKLGGKLWRHLKPIANHYLPLRRRRDAWIAGILWGWLPCGLVYSTLTLSATSGSGWSGGLIMAVFGLATLPATLSLGLAGSRIRSVPSHGSVRAVSVVLLLLFGLLSIGSVIPFGNKFML